MPLSKTHSKTHVLYWFLVVLQVWINYYANEKGTSQISFFIYLFLFLFFLKVLYGFDI